MDLRLVRLDGRYRLQKKIGSGSFGTLRGYFTCPYKTVVIKLEPLNARQHFLEHEYQVYQKLSGGIGIPRTRWFGTEGGFDILALDRLGQSLEDLFVSCYVKFTVQTVLLLADQLIERVKFIHSRNFIHRDLKPSNIVMGMGTQAPVVYLIDFGLSKEYRDPDTYKHIPLNTNLGLTGTATFASINSHLGSELGQRDDMESLAYMLIYFLRGRLPWQGLPNGSKRIIKCKQRTTPRDLCQGLPVEFCTFLKYCHSLGFEEKPDYGYIGDLFKNLSSRESFQNVVVFDWDRTDNGQPQNRVSDGLGGYTNRIVGGQRDQIPKRREGYVAFLFVNIICSSQALSRLHSQRHKSSSGITST
ncbi:CK1/CK1/CK1-D protein kinase [Lactarius hengduanensis]|nr:CK1/CK1/CK1-D protein kinase [Lactarius hengduanensis]